MGAAAAWWLHQPPGARPRVSLPLPPLVQPPEPVPTRDQLVQLRLDQELLVERPDGQLLPIGYTSAVIDPRWVTVDFFGGWNRELEANTDLNALLFTSGPTFARGRGNGALGMRLHGDLLMGNGVWPAGNKAAAAGRAWVGITKEGTLEFGYGALTPALTRRLRVFIGGLHAFSNTTRAAPASYVGVYGEMKLADVRIIYGLRPDGLLELLEIPGLGGKKIKVLHEELGVDSIESLTDACHAGKVAELKGFGKHSPVRTDSLGFWLVSTNHLHKWTSKSRCSSRNWRRSLLLK